MCTRVFNNRNEAFLTTARNMDWKTELPTSIYAFKSGIKKFALDGTESGEYTNWDWTAQYSSIVAMVGTDELGYGSSDGINSEGLVANMLYDKNADYKLAESKNSKPLNILRWAQYVLDNFKTAAEVKKAFSENQIELVEVDVPGSDSPAALHLSVSDRFGDSTIIEVYGGEYHIHHSKKYTVMTNDPNFDTQLKLNDYWLWQWSEENSFPSHTIPGGPFAADRFERATYYYQHLNAPDSFQESLAQAKSVVANASVPLGMKGFAGHPNIAPTIWTVLSDHLQLKYYFCNARTPNIVWIDMNKKLPDAEVSKLDVVVEKDGTFISLEFVGCINDQLKSTNNPFS